MSFCVTFENGVFIIKGSIRDPVLKKNVMRDFIFNPMDKRFETRNATKAARLLEHFDDKAKAQYNLHAFKLCLPPPNIKGLELLHEYQKDAVRWALQRNHFYLALQQGLGKTLVALTVALNLPGPTLIVCPPFLIENWKREVEKWLSLKALSIREKDAMLARFVIVSDGLILNSEVRASILSRGFQFLIIDEAQRFKTYQARRTFFLFRDIVPNIPRVGLLSGTPMPNRPMELFVPLSYLASNLIDFKSYRQFGVRYANGFEGPYGWDYSGASNLEELKKKIEPFMFRRTKFQVLKELRPKQVEHVYLTLKTPAVLKTQLKNLQRKYTPEEIISNQRLGEIASAREKVGYAKAGTVIEYMDDFWDGFTPTLLFAWHHSVISKLADHFKVTPITGKLSMEKREEVIKRFMGGKDNILIANVQTMVGYNLTRATQVVFAEFSWCPSDNEQAEDRAHRIGQDANVLVQYLIAEGTLDEHVMNVLKSKKRNITTLIT